MPWIFLLFFLGPSLNAQPPEWEDRFKLLVDYTKDRFEYIAEKGFTKTQVKIFIYDLDSTTKGDSVPPEKDKEVFFDRYLKIFQKHKHYNFLKTAVALWRTDSFDLLVQLDKNKNTLTAIIADAILITRWHTFGRHSTQSDTLEWLRNMRQSKTQLEKTKALLAHLSKGPHNPRNLWKYAQSSAASFPDISRDAKFVSSLKNILKDYWKLRMQLAYSPTFRGRYTGEQNNGHFLLHSEALRAAPALIEAILNEPGTTITMIVADPKEEKWGLPVEKTKLETTLSKIPKAWRARIQGVLGPGKNYMLWITDYRGLTVEKLEENQSKQVLLHSLDSQDEKDRENFAIRVQNKISKFPIENFPLALDGGNILAFRGRSGKNYVALSEQFIEMNQEIGFPKETIKKVAKQYLASGKDTELLIVPYNDPEGTGHIDMDVLRIPAKKPGQSDTLIIGNYTNPSLLRQAFTLPRGHGDFESNMDLIEEGEETQAVNQQLYNTLSKYAHVVTVPNISPTYYRDQNVRSYLSQLNALLFYNQKKELVLIAPKAPEGNHVEKISEAFADTLEKWVDRVVFVPDTLHLLSGGPHCVAPQCFPEPKPKK